MSKTEVQLTLKMGVDRGGLPLSPRIPPKRAKVTLDQVAPNPECLPCPSPTPPLFIRKMRNAAVGTGCDIRLKVAVAGDPQPDLYWYRNDVLLDTEDQEYGGLWIHDCQPGDAGLYSCIASNYLGEARSSAVLAVLDLGEDSETTEDEAAEPQTSAVIKEENGGLREEAGLPTGDSNVTMEVGLDASDWAASQSTVVEGEMFALGSRGPGQQDLSKAVRSQSEEVLREVATQGLSPPSYKGSQRTISPLPSCSGSAIAAPLTPRRKVVVPTEYQDTVPGEFEEKIKQPKSSAMSQSSTVDSRPQTPVSEYSRKDLTPRPSPKLSRVSSKIFEEVFKERRRSIDQPEGSISGRSWAGFHRTSSVDSDDGRNCLGISRESSKEDLREALKVDADQRRSMFKQRATSLEDRPRYNQKVQDIENKFTEELQRIKKLVGKPHMRKSFSTEQLSHRSRQPLRKLEPIPPQVLQKLQDRERIQYLLEQKQIEKGERLPQKSPQLQHQQRHLSPQHESLVTLTEIPVVTLDTSENESTSLRGKRNALSPRHKLPEKIPKSSPNSEVQDNLALPSELERLPKQESASNKVELSLHKVVQRPISPIVQTDCKMSVKDFYQAQHSPVPTYVKEETLPHKTELSIRRIEQRPGSPLVQSELPFVQESQSQSRSCRFISPSTSMPISEDDMEVVEKELSHLPNVDGCCKIVEEHSKNVKSCERTKNLRNVKENHSQKIHGKGHQMLHQSPDQDSSDDSYVSAGEDPQEAPMFEYPLQDTIASTGLDVLLSCIVVGTPLPKVTWKKDKVKIENSSSHVVKVEGDRNTLLIKRAKRSDSGTYCVIAVNEMGVVQCSATLFIKPEPLLEHCGRLNVPIELGSPITSDEEYLSPLEESLDFGGPTYQTEPRKIVDIRLKDAPSFQVSLVNQVVYEGQEVVMIVRIQGEPKPIVYWLRDRVTIKTDSRHKVQEMEDDRFAMKIMAAQKCDAGVYTCKIINEYGTKQCECKLDVKVPPVEPALAITRHVSDVTVRAGESASFECSVTGPQDVDVDWLSDGKLIQPALLSCKMHFDGRTSRLLLNSVHEDDSGSYMCKLSTAKEELTSSGRLKVIPSIQPLFTRRLDVLEVIEGRPACFNCKVSGTPPPTVTWSHFENSLEDDESRRIIKDGGRHSLLILHVSSQNEGRYTAMAQNPHGQAQCSAELYVQEPRPAMSANMAKLEKMPSIPEEPEVPENEVEHTTMPDFVKPLCDLDVVEGKEAILKCKVAGMPYPTITWFHNGRKIESTNDRKMAECKDLHSLVIRSVCHAHGGVYKSVISNQVGKATCYAHLYVMDILPNPPDWPPIVEAITGKTVTLSWKRPNKLDPSIDPDSVMYAVQQQALGSIQWTIIVSGLKQTSYTVTTLSKGVRYFFRVLSITNKAISKPSPSTDAVQLLDRGPYLPEAPVIIDKPDIVYMVEKQFVSITITLNHVEASVTWKRNGVLISSRPGLYETSMPDDDQHTVKMFKVKSSDVGQLVCTACNQFGSDSCVLLLEMAAPPVFESIMEDLDVAVGETPRFVVIVEGNPVPDILWYKNDSLLSESSHFSFVYDDNECSLVILNTQVEDSGVYTCTAKNQAGSVSCKAELTVHAVSQQAEELVEDEATLMRRMRRLSDYYDLHKEIGRGAFSYVKQVTQKAGKADYAAKFITAHGKRKTMAMRELELLSRLDHQRIIYFHDAFEKKNVVVIISELCSEEFLERIVKRSVVMESEIRSIIRELLEGLEYLHQNNILHLDIKPENILMAEKGVDHIRICDFGNAVEISSNKELYCKYGTPEFVAPEIVNQTPVSKATDIWPVGVISYLCLTGVSPFAGENDRSTVLNIRYSNVAFEEKMFDGLCQEAKGFIIKLLEAMSLRPDARECLQHPWFKNLTKGKAINTEHLSQFLSCRRWQRSLINYKSKMVMRSIPELLDDASSHTSIAIPKHLKKDASSMSSSSDSDEDIDELPFIPMPLKVEFSRSRMSLTEIPSGKDTRDGPNGMEVKDVPMESEPKEREKKDAETEVRGRTQKRVAREDRDSSDKELTEVNNTAEQPKITIRRVSSVESKKTEAVHRRGELRRGGSADSALLIYIKAEEGEVEGLGNNRKCLTKAVSMELPRRSASPGAAKLSKEDYALKLELLRQRLLKGSAVNKQMSGLRGPLLETLGGCDEKRTPPQDRYMQPDRSSAHPLTRAASSDSQREVTQKINILRKSASFSQGDTEDLPLHRRSGAPLEIPLAQIEKRRLQEAVSMSALAESTNENSQPVTLRAVVSSKSPYHMLVEERLEVNVTKENGGIMKEKEQKYEESVMKQVIDDKNATELNKLYRTVKELEKETQIALPSVVNTINMVEEEEKNYEMSMVEENVKSIEPTPDIDIIACSNKVIPTNIAENNTPIVTASFAAVAPPARVTLSNGRTSAYASVMQTIMVPSLQPVKILMPAPAVRSVLMTSPSSLKQEPPPSAEHPAIFSRIASVEEPASPPKTPTVPILPQEPSVGCNIIDIASEDVFNARFKKPESSLTRGLKFLSRVKPDEKSVPVLVEDIYRPGSVSAPLEMIKPRILEKFKSVQDLREASKDRNFMKRLSMRLKKTQSTEQREDKLGEDIPASEPRRRPSWTFGHGKLKEKKEVEMVRLDGGPKAPQDEREPKETSQSPVLVIRRKIESTVAGMAMKIRSQSEDKKEDKASEDMPESKKTQFLSILRRSSSEVFNLKKIGLFQNQLELQSGATASTESLDSTSSIQSESAIKKQNGDRRPRWDRWSLTLGRKNKTISQPDIQSAIARESGSMPSPQYSRLSSDFPPVFHIKLKNHLLLDGDPVTLSCLPAASPHPHITWLKDKKPLEIDARMNMISCPDGRQLLMIMRTSKKDAGLYECIATNPLGSVTSSCALSLAQIPEAPGKPEVSQKHQNTALVMWKPTPTAGPCTYSLECKKEGEAKWFIVATGLSECYYTMTELPAAATLTFRVACVNKAGQSAYSNSSAPVTSTASEAEKPSSTRVVKTSSVVVPPMRPPPPVKVPLRPPPPASVKSTPSHSNSHAAPPAPTSAKAKSTLSINVSTPLQPSAHPTPERPDSQDMPLIGNPISPLPLYVPISSSPDNDSTLRQSLPPSAMPVSCHTSTPSTKLGEMTLRQGVPQKPYTFMDEKARGRFGVIRECRENATGNIFMAKIVPYEPKSKQAVLQEYDILKSLHHEKIMSLHEAYVTPRYLVLISEYCAGKELLYSLVERFRYSEEDVVSYIGQILLGLEYLHCRRILHLDIKPENIMVTFKNVIKIVDFGSAQTFNPLFLKQYSHGQGILEYMSPEMVKGDVLGPPADIWGIGVLLYIMLSGQLPFMESHPAETEAKIVAAKFDLSRLYPNVSQNASLFLKKILCGYPWARPTIKDCFNNVWLQDVYLMRLRRQTITFTTTLLRDFLEEHQQRRIREATKHKVLLRSYHSNPSTPTSPMPPATP